MKNLENKNISKVRNNKNQSIFNNSQFVLNILYATSIKHQNNKSYPR
nr:hypothetical protein [uncultured Faecalibacillus sp.]